MEDIIISVNELPNHLLKRMDCEEVKIHEVNGVITLIPLCKKNATRLFGMLANSGLSTEAYNRQKQLDKELE